MLCVKFKIEIPPRANRLINIPLTSFVCIIMYHYYIFVEYYKRNKEY